MDEELVRGCLAGNEDAWVVLIDKYKKLVYSIPAKFRLPVEDAADIFQCVWADLYRDLPHLEQPGAVRGWLVTAATRRCLLLKKKRQRLWGQTEGRVELADPAPDVVSIRAEAEQVQALREAVSQLPERCRRIVEMLFYEYPPRPYAEVARGLGLAEGSIGFIRGRCLKKLKSLLDQAGT